MANHIQVWLLKTKSGINCPYSLVIGFLLIILGILSRIWTPYELLLEERSRMRPGMPAFEWWLDPPYANLHVFVYNVTNAERFLSGEDAELLMQEVGPIVYKEMWKHQNVGFNDNGTMTYYVNRTLVLDEDYPIDVNATITVPNIAVLGTISHLWDVPMFTKFALNSMFDFLDSQPFKVTTIYNFLHNSYDPFLNVAHNIAPFLAPVQNVGIINLLYRNFNGNVTAFVGTESGHELFARVDKYHGSTNIPGHDDSCKFKITNSSEGILYNQMITPETVLKYYRKPVCRPVNLYYEGEYTIYGIRTYKFIIPKDEFKRIYPPEDDCFDTKPTLPNGISSISECMLTFPVAVSYVYFNYTDETFKTCAKIIKPQGKTVPLPHVYVEPTTGIPLISSAPLQTNLYIRPLRGFRKIFDKFSNQMIPLFWLHYYSDGLPFKVMCLIHIILAMPIVGWVLTVIFLMTGIFYIWKSTRRKNTMEEEKVNASRESLKNGAIELEAFINSKK